ncbi:hypothetical protein BT69DRAFT_1337923 [Atractiella rhizophila]|nr:hypothetical protein BT69DRAFT_1337923 [Atractiella rhizophila]
MGCNLTSILCPSKEFTHSEDPEDCNVVVKAGESEKEEEEEVIVQGQKTVKHSYSVRAECTEPASKPENTTLLEFDVDDMIYEFKEKVIEVLKTFRPGKKTPKSWKLDLHGCRWSFQNAGATVTLTTVAKKIRLVDDKAWNCMLQMVKEKAQSGRGGRRVGINIFLREPHQILRNHKEKKNPSGTKDDLDLDIQKSIQDTPLATRSNYVKHRREISSSETSSQEEEVVRLTPKKRKKKKAKTGVLMTPLPQM